MVQMVLLLSVLRVTTVIKLSVISYFHVVNSSSRLNKMMVNTNCKQSSVQLFCSITVHDDVKCVIFCEELMTHVG